MTLPQVPAAWLIDGRKISAYLMNTEHPRGASKAKYLMGFGFTRMLLTSWQMQS
ncbi:DUF6883 domain-containing protein [Methylobacterium platani]|uniref:DUF6883 domain-containing protein n=1 Tax=Methylobacterium platani TaxID=427683 RepID=UPI000A47DD5A|nr:DUF6883 domain-containing protein [Methylobacterium platani]